MLRLPSRHRRAHSGPGRVRSPLFYGWWIVYAALLISIYNVGTFFYGFTAFFNPLIKEFGWSRAVTSLAFTLQRAESGTAAPVVGYLVDKVGPRRVTITGAFLAGVGFIWLSYVQSLWSFYGSFLLIGLGLSASSPEVPLVAVANWFRRKRGRAMAVLAVGAGVGGIVIPGIVWGVDTFGWRAAVRGIGVGTWLVVIPLALVYRHQPERYGYLPDGDAPGGSAVARDRVARTSEASEEASFTVRQVLRTHAFWLLGLIFTLWMFVHGTIMVHILPALTAAGLSRGVAALVVAGMPLISIVGRLGLGFLGDFLGKSLVIAMSLLLMTVGTLIFSFTHSVWQAILFMAAYGIGFGGFIAVKGALQADFFGRRNYGTVQGGLHTLGMVGGMVGPVFAGWWFDVNESYQGALVVLAIAIAATIPLAFALKAPERVQGGRPRLPFS